MKKLNKKGFTLVELLAVIVVLAIIMVIATTQINSTIKKSRVDSFLSTFQVAMNASKTCNVQDLTGDNCEALVDYSTSDYSLEIEKKADGSGYTIKLSAVSTGKFSGINIKQYYANDDAIIKALGTNSTSLANITAGPTNMLQADYLMTDADL